MITKDTAQSIAFSYREVEIAGELLSKIAEALDRNQSPDIRDVFGRQRHGLQLGVPTGSDGHRLFDVPWSLARPIIEAHIAHHRAIIASLSEKARAEIDTR